MGCNSPQVHDHRRKIDRSERTADFEPDPRATRRRRVALRRVVPHEREGGRPERNRVEPIARLRTILMLNRPRPTRDPNVLFQGVGVVLYPQVALHAGVVGERVGENAARVFQSVMLAADGQAKTLGRFVPPLGRVSLSVGGPTAGEAPVYPSRLAQVMDLPSDILDVPEELRGHAHLVISEHVAVVGRGAPGRIRREAVGADAHVRLAGEIHREDGFVVLDAVAEVRAVGYERRFRVEQVLRHPTHRHRDAGGQGAYRLHGGGRRDHPTFGVGLTGL